MATCVKSESSDKNLIKIKDCSHVNMCITWHFILASYRVDCMSSFTDAWQTTLVKLSECRSLTLYIGLLKRKLRVALTASFVNDACTVNVICKFILFSTAHFTLSFNHILSLSLRLSVPPSLFLSLSLSLSVSLILPPFSSLSPSLSLSLSLHKQFNSLAYQLKQVMSEFRHLEEDYKERSKGIIRRQLQASKQSNISLQPYI